MRWYGVDIRRIDYWRKEQKEGRDLRKLSGGNKERETGDEANLSWASRSGSVDATRARGRASPRTIRTPSRRSPPKRMATPSASRREGHPARPVRTLPIPCLTGGRTLNSRHSDMLQRERELTAWQARPTWARCRRHLLAVPLEGRWTRFRPVYVFSQTRHRPKRQRCFGVVAGRRLRAKRYVSRRTCLDRHGSAVEPDGRPLLAEPVCTSETTVRSSTCESAA